MSQELLMVELQEADGSARVRSLGSSDVEFD